MFVLPNLVLPDPDSAGSPKYSMESPDLLERGLDLGTDLIALAPQGDPRVRAICEASPTTKRFLESFRENDGSGYRPAVLIARERLRATGDADTRWSAEALVAFRNAVAMSTILHGRAAIAAGDARSGPTWSDTFDFHFAQVDRGEQLRIISPILISMDNLEAYLAMPAHHIEVYSEGRMLGDPLLYRALGTEWRRRYGGTGRDTRYGRRLFRSLELAYLAASVPTKNHASMHEHGVQLALWVSACEILAHPRGVKSVPVPHSGGSPPASRRRRRHVNEPHVMDLLAAYEWDDARLRRRDHAVRVGRRKHRSINAVQRAYRALYRARNAFLHGNDVRSELFFPWGRRGRRGGSPLTATAAVVYRTALCAYLRRYRGRGSPKNFGRDFMESMAEQEYEKALLSVLHLDD